MTNLTTKPLTLMAAVGPGNQVVAPDHRDALTAGAIGYAGHRTEVQIS